MSIDTDRFRAELEQQRERLPATIEHHDIGGASLTEETGELMSSSADNHLADTASETYERELDEGLEEDAQRPAARRSTSALARIDAGDVRHLRGLRQGDPASSGSRRSRGRRSASTTRGSRRGDRAGPTRAPPPLDVRVGSSTNALRPISAAERSLGAGPRQWLGLGAIALAAVARRPADEAGRRPHARARRGGRRSPGRSRSTTSTTPGSRSGSSRARPSIVIVAHGARRRAGCSSSSRARARATRCCRSRSASCSAAASRTCSTASGSATSPTSSTSATGRRSTSPTSSSSSASAILFAALAGADRAKHRPAALATLRFRAPEAERLDRALAGARRGRLPRRSPSG